MKNRPKPSRIMEPNQFPVVGGIVCGLIVLLMVGFFIKVAIWADKVGALK